MKFGVAYYEVNRRGDETVHGLSLKQNSRSTFLFLFSPNSVLGGRVVRTCTSPPVHRKQCARGHADVLWFFVPRGCATETACLRHHRFSEMMWLLSGVGGMEDDRQTEPQTNVVDFINKLILNDDGCVCICVSGGGSGVVERKCDTPEWLRPCG